ncbi:hypothetical protein DESC_30011 [Desulfosarcina cetonica]|nr:hypothetical protein DESC_30011 [Desulfosarcina cetonica]
MVEKTGVSYRPWKSEKVKPYLTLPHFLEHTENIGVFMQDTYRH